MLVQGVGILQYEMDGRELISLQQVSPHFLFNVINTAKSAVLLGMDNTAELMDEMAGYLRFVLKQYSPQDRIPGVKALRFLKDYASLEEARFTHISIKYQIETTDFMIQPFWLKEILHNAIHHGVLQRKAGGIILVRVSRDGEWCSITISDNGMGMSKEQSACLLSADGISGKMAEQLKKEDGSVRLESGLQIGTDVMITLPAVRYAEREWGKAGRSREVFCENNFGG
ncbi:MAG: histidine kinase [Clostridiaceae bacterium]|nr:histidine kinase [Clostridiaceae bacterium]